MTLFARGEKEAKLKHAQPNVKQYLVEYFSELFWSLMTEVSRKSANVMQANDELQKNV